MFELYLPIPHLWIIYGAIALVIEMLIGFIVEISRGILALSNLSHYLPIKGPTRN